MELATDLGCPATDLFGVSVIACSEKPTKGCFLQTHSRADKTKFYSENAIKFQYAASSKFCIKSHLRYQMALGGWGRTSGGLSWATWCGRSITGSGALQLQLPCWGTSLRKMLLVYRGYPQCLVRYQTALMVFLLENPGTQFNFLVVTRNAFPPETYCRLR